MPPNPGGRLPRRVPIILYRAPAFDSSRYFIGPFGANGPLQKSREGEIEDSRRNQGANPPEMRVFSRICNAAFGQEVRLLPAFEFCNGLLNRGWRQGRA